MSRIAEMTRREDDGHPIRIFLRARPSRRASLNAKIDIESSQVEFIVPKDLSNGYVNNQTESHTFLFDGVFDGSATQDAVFETVAVEVIQGCLEGYNGTLFAYGQTGSGKTFTITGGPERYVDRGIIPRAISAIFSEIAQRADHAFVVHVSYLEIYNDVVYDLLDPEREIKDIDDLPKVLIREDEHGELAFSNLRTCKVDNEEDALSLLFLGDTNRTISETPMNMASSRSHCIFSIHIHSRKNGADVVRTSKLNLVDLAGSERVKKTGIDGVTLVESKHINLSLHYLEQVIVALQEDAMGAGRSHIPYRNSAMTLLLRDSLGGNCRTVMIANISIEQRQLDESISTCRFAQRVAMISNQAIVNEEVDSSLVIARLKQEIVDLKQEIRLLRGEEGDQSGEITEESKEAFRAELIDYCSDNSETQLNLNRSMLLLRYGFEVMKELVRTAKQSNETIRRSEKNQSGKQESSQKQQDTGGEAEKVTVPEVSQEGQWKKFEKQYSKKEVILNNQTQLKRRFAAAKAEGQKLTESKARLTELKSIIEKKRLKRSVAALCRAPGSGSNDSLDQPDEEEQEAIQSLTEEKARYKSSFYKLRDLKQEVENLQKLLEINRQQMQSDFEEWMAKRANKPEKMNNEIDSYVQKVKLDDDIHPDALASAQKHFTGNPEVDRDILKFYQNKQKLQQQ